MNFELTVLGSGSALPTTRRYPTAQALNVLERFFLIDCGEGTQLQLRHSKFRVSKINHIFISHLHGDHIFGLFGLLSTYNLLGRKQDLYIHAHENMKNILGFFKDNFAEGLQYNIRFVPLIHGGLNLVFEDKLVEVFSFPLKHRVPSFGYLFKEKKREPNIRKEMIEHLSLGVKDILKIKEGSGFVRDDGKEFKHEDLVIRSQAPRSYAFCSDTGYYERIIPWIKGVDMLYHEATFMDAEITIAKQTGHSTALQAAKIAKKAEVGSLIIGHFSNRYKDLANLLNEARSVFPNTNLAEDLTTYLVPQKSQDQ